MYDICRKETCTCLLCFHFMSAASFQEIYAEFLSNWRLMTIHDVIRLLVFVVSDFLTIVIYT